MKLEVTCVPYFLQGTTVSWNHDTVFLRGGGTPAISSRLAAQVVPLIDGKRTVGEIAALAGSDVSEEQALSVVSRLVALAVIACHPMIAGTAKDGVESFWTGIAPKLVEAINSDQVLYLPNGSKWTHGFSRDRFLELTTESHAIRVTYPSEGRRGMDRSFEDDPRSVRFHYENGGTICLTGLEKRDRTLGILAIELRRRIGWTGVVDCRSYLSNHGSGYTPHFDMRSVLTIQVEGEKQWLVDKLPAVKYPMCNAGQFPDGHFGYFRDDPKMESWEEFADPSFPAEARSIRLSPGDVLFVPAGVWHSAEALGHSLSVTLTLNYDNYGSLKDLLLRAIDGRLSAQAAFRGPPPVAIRDEVDWPALSPAAHASIDEALASLRTLLEGLSVSEVESRWRNTEGRDAS